MFSLAHQGVPWAAKYVKDAPTMRVQQKGHAMPKPEPKYDKEKSEIVKKALRMHGRERH